MRGARFACALGWLALAAEAHAQPGRRPMPQPAPPAPSATAPLRAPESNTDLRAHFGADVAGRLLHSSDPEERLRGIARAAGAGAPEGMALLVQAAESTGAARGDARAMIEVARGLASFADQSSARTALIGLVNAAPSSTVVRAPRAGSEPYADDTDHLARMQLARETAALALAGSGDPRGLDALVVITRAGGAGQSAATMALTAFPMTLANGLAATSLMAPASMRLLSQLGDLRALESIRTAAKSTDVSTRAVALIALGEMGDGRAVELARAALAEKDPRLRNAAGEALVLLDAPERFAAVEALIGDDVTAAKGVLLAQRVSNDKIARALAARAVASADPQVRADAIVALGRSSSPDALRALDALVQSPLLESDAAQALGRSPNPGALASIERLLGTSDAAKRRLGLRAYVLRALTRHAESDVARATLARLEASKDPRDHVLAIFSLVALGERPLEEALGDGDPRARRAAAMASLSKPSGPSRAALLSRLAREPDPATRQVLAIGLVEGDPRGDVTTLTLVDRAESGESDAPLAAMALARRSEAAQDPKVNSLLASRDGVLRAHAARGLGMSRAPDAVGRLAAAYAYEVDPAVRRAIVIALSVSGTNAAAPSRQLTLKLASRLDPDRLVRWTALRALAKIPAEAAASLPSEVAWVRLTAAEGTKIPDDMLASLVRADGLALPLAFDEEGYALLPGVTPGEARLFLAPRVSAYEALKR